MSAHERVLITGATGFLGAWIIAGLLRAGKQVVATDLHCDTRRLDLLLSPEEQKQLEWRACDVTDSEAVRVTVKQVQPQTLIHLAALQIPACRANPNLCAQVNVLGHINVFEAARQNQVKRVIYTSSIAAKPRGPANAPANFYGVFKKTDEEIARLYWEDHAISSLGLRPYIVYGVGRDEGETSAITRAMQAAALGEAYEIPFSTLSCLQYAGEVAGIFRLCSEASWEGALLSDITTEVHSTEQLVALINQEIPEAAISIADKVRVSPTEGFDNAPLKSVIGQWPQTSLRAGIRETVTLFRRLSMA